MFRLWKPSSPFSILLAGTVVLQAAPALTADPPEKPNVFEVTKVDLAATGTGCHISVTNRNSASATSVLRLDFAAPGLAKLDDLRIVSLGNVARLDPFPFEKPPKPSGAALVWVAQLHAKQSDQPMTATFAIPQSSCKLSCVLEVPEIGAQEDGVLLLSLVPTWSLTLTNGSGIIWPPGALLSLPDEPKERVPMDGQLAVPLSDGKDAVFPAESAPLKATGKVVLEIPRSDDGLMGELVPQLTVQFPEKLPRTSFPATLQFSHRGRLIGAAVPRIDQAPKETLIPMVLPPVTKKVRVEKIPVGVSTSGQLIVRTRTTLELTNSQPYAVFLQKLPDPCGPKTPMLPAGSKEVPGTATVSMGGPMEYASLAIRASATVEEQLGEIADVKKRLESAITLVDPNAKGVLAGFRQSLESLKAEIVTLEMAINNGGTSAERLAKVSAYNASARQAARGPDASCPPLLYRTTSNAMHILGSTASHGCTDATANSTDSI